MSTFPTEIALPEELHPFVMSVLTHPKLQQRLAPIAEMDAFIEEALKVSYENGVALDRAMFTNAMRPDPIGLGRFASAPMTFSGWPPSGWLPTRSVPTDGTPAMDWLWFGSERLSRPFMEDDVRTASCLPFNRLFRIRTTMDAVIAGSRRELHIPLRGLIFHMSRCGSTLLAQMFAAVPEYIVSSEPEPLDAVIQWLRLANIDEEVGATALRAIVAALGRDRQNGAQHHIIKVDAWHAFFLPLFRAAFPDVNWVYLYRDATEVMVSTMQQPGVHTAPGVLPESIVGFALDSCGTIEHYSARVLGEIGNSVLRHWHLGGGMLIAYPDLVKAATNAVPGHLNVDLNDSAIALMMATAKQDAKSPQQHFSNDILRKQTMATVAINEAAERWMLPVQIELDQLLKSTVNNVEAPQKTQLND